MKPTEYSTYWKHLSLWIREVRAGGVCECRQECGQQHARRCEERYGQLVVRPSPRRKLDRAHPRVRLTCAHLCQNTFCARERHVRAMCDRCHLNYDLHQHIRNAKRVPSETIRPRNLKYLRSCTTEVSATNQHKYLRYYCNRPLGS
jgi:hypothetical protein